MDGIFSSLGLGSSDMAAFKIVGVFAGGTDSPNYTIAVSITTSDWDFGIVLSGSYTFTYNISSSSTSTSTISLTAPIAFYRGLTTCYGAFDGKAVKFATSISASSISLNYGIAVSGFVAKYT